MALLGIKFVALLSRPLGKTKASEQIQASLDKQSKQEKWRTKSKQVAKDKQNKKPKSSTQNASKIEGFKI